MRAAISIPLAVSFVLLATFNVWSMLSSHNRSNIPARWWTRLHRAAGYGFIALFAVLSYFMLLRIRGWPDELSPRIVLHMALAFALAPLLIVKVIAVRSRRSSYALLCALGITIYAMAFTLVTINVTVHFFRKASAEKVPFWTSSIFVFAVILVAGLAFASKQKVKEPRNFVMSFLPALNKGGKRRLALCTPNCEICGPRSLSRLIALLSPFLRIQLA